MYNLTKRQVELNNIRDNVASVRHLLDSVRLDAQDACKEKPDFARAETRARLTEEFGEIQENIWIIENCLETLEDFERAAPPTVEIPNNTRPSVAPVGLA